MLHVEGLSKRFGAKEAVDDVTFKIEPGEIFSLIGPNGSGKTTVVKLIAGLLRPTAGVMTVDGKDVVGDPVAAKSRTGYIPDEPAVWPGMTGEEFLHMTGALWGLDERTRMERVPPLLDLFSLRGIEKEGFENYSRGNKQKFAILAALVHEPKLLLIDEPIVGLDPTSAEIAKRAFMTFARTGGAILLVTHTLPVAEEIASRVGVLVRGRLLAHDTVPDLRKAAKLPANAPLGDVYRVYAERT